MGTPITDDQLLTALRKWRVKYKEYAGWRTRGRPGGIVDARGIVKHHTGGGSASDSYLEFLFVTGRPEDGIPGPLCNVATAPDGILHIGAIGRANHAGRGSQTTMDHVVAEDYAGYLDELTPGPDAINGNAYYYGNEIIYSGLVPPTDAAYRTSVLYAAALCDFHGWSALSVIAHREHTRRKTDPGHVPMTKFRTDLATVLRIGPEVAWSGKTPIEPPKGTPVTPTEIQAVADAVWAKMLGPSTASDCAQKARSAAEAWGDGGKRTRTLNEIAADVAAIKAKLNLS